MNGRIEEKIGQMVMIGFRGNDAGDNSQIVETIRDMNLCGVWLTNVGSGSEEKHGNIVSPDQVKKLVADLQKNAETPLFISIDAEGGQIIRLLEKYGFPTTYSPEYLGEKNDIDFTGEKSEIIAELLEDLKINMNLAPLLDLNKNADNPAIGKKGRSFSADAGVVTKHAESFIKKHHEKGILCCVKHFPGQGSAALDSHVESVDVSGTWSEDELEPYRYLISRNMADAVLTAHIKLEKYDNVYPATLSEKIIDGLLRKELGFDGVVISDDMTMGAIAKNFGYKEALKLGINAGLDIILQPNVMGYDENIAAKTINTIKELVKEGSISEERIELSYNRIMKLKRKLKF